MHHFKDTPLAGISTVMPADTLAFIPENASQCEYAFVVACDCLSSVHCVCL